MNYQRIYASIIESRINSKPDRYERHHIVPKSLGGTNQGYNLVCLTPREHYLCHKLLAKIHGGKMWQALFVMSHGKTTSARGVKVKSRDYEAAKIRVAELQAENEALRDSMTGINNPSSDKDVYRFSHKDFGVIDCSRSELCARFELTAKGVSKIVTGTARSHKGWCWHGLSKDSCVTSHTKRQHKLSGRAVSSEHAESLKAAKAKEPKVTCPHCETTGKGGVMGRWHFDRCKLK